MINWRVFYWVKQDRYDNRVNYQESQEVFFPLSDKKWDGIAELHGRCKTEKSTPSQVTMSEIISKLGLYFFSWMSKWISTDYIILKNQLGLCNNLLN